MKLDLTKTNGSSPPIGYAAQQEGLMSTVRADDEIWTVSEVASYLKMSPRQVWELTRRRGQERSDLPLPCFKIHSKCLRFRKHDVQQWLEALADRARVQ